MTATAIRDGCGIPDRTVFCMANLNDIRPGAWARWLLLGVVAVHLAIVWWNRDPAMINADTAQLVTATQNLLDGRGYSTSALYTLINTRLTRAKATIISTNCSNEELQKKYTPQILSRIEGEYQTLPFVGRDIRQIKKEREA